MAHENPISMQQLLQTLEGKGFLVNGNAIADFISVQPQNSPLYLQILAGIGAFFSAIFLLGFLGISKLINFDSISSLALGGITFSFIAILLQRATEKKDAFSYSFTIQLSFCAMAVGKGLMVGASLLFSETLWSIPFSMLVITIATYHIYPLALDRFMSALVTLVALMANALWNPEMMVAIYQQPIVNSLFIIQIALFAFLTIKVKRDYIPLSYALAFSLSIAVTLLVGRIDSLFHRPSFPLGIMNFTLAIAIIILIAWIAGGIHKLQKEPLVVASVGTVILGIVSAPGLLLAIGFLILGYAQHERLLVTMGSLLLPVFIFLYYYHLEVTLIYKSAILIMTGIVLLLGYFYLKYRGFNQ